MTEAAKPGTMWGWKKCQVVENVRPDKPDGHNSSPPWLLRGGQAWRDLSDSPATLQVLVFTHVGGAKRLNTLRDMLQLGKSAERLISFQSSICASRSFSFAVTLL